MNEKVVKYLKENFKNSFDVKYREIVTDRGVITIVYVDNMCDSKYISEFIIAPLMEARSNIGSMIDIQKGVLAASSIGIVKTKNDLLTHLLSGDTIIIFSFMEDIIYCDSKGFSKRGITTPITEAQIKGPREGFNEVLTDNLSLIRRRIKDPSLKFESMMIGSKTSTTVVMAYIEDTTDLKLVEYIRSQLKSIESEALLNINIIEEKLKCKHTPFDTIGYTEKPDVVASRLCEGRIAIMVDGTPFVAAAPYFL